MTSPTLSPRVVPLSNTDEPVRSILLNSPRISPQSSPRALVSSEKASIRASIESWRSGSTNIDDVVRDLSEKGAQRRSFAKKAYVAFMENVRVEANVEVLKTSRQSLYAASVFAEIAECETEFQAADSAYIARENEIMTSNPELRRGKL